MFVDSQNSNAMITLTLCVSPRNNFRIATRTPTLLLRPLRRSVKHIRRLRLQRLRPSTKLRARTLVEGCYGCMCTRALLGRKVWSYPLVLLNTLIWRLWNVLTRLTYETNFLLEYFITCFSNLDPEMFLGRWFHLVDRLCVQSSKVSLHSSDWNSGRKRRTRMLLRSRKRRDINDASTTSSTPSTLWTILRKQASQ